jgi:hypothetical protein
LKNRKAPSAQIQKPSIEVPSLDYNMNRTGLAQIETPQSIVSGRHTNRALKGIDDELLVDLSNEQKEYIVKCLYPSL